MAREITPLEFEQTRSLLPIFDILGQLHDQNPQLAVDCLNAMMTEIREANNRVETDRRFAAITIDQWTKVVAAVSGVDRKLVALCADAALAPSRLQNMLAVAREHIKNARDPLTQ